MTKESKWAIGVAISVAAVVISILGFLLASWTSYETTRQNAERERREEPSLVSNGVPYSPDAKTSRICFVTFQSKYFESRQAVVKRIVFTVIRSEPTEVRGCSAPADYIPVRFTRKDLRGQNKFEFFFKPPETVKGGENIIFGLSLTDPEQVGRTYVGQLKIFYDNNKVYAYRDPVRIDISATPPETRSPD